MKSLLSNTKICLLAVATILMLTSSLPAAAEITSTPGQEPHSVPVELRYKGIVSDSPVFDLVFTSEEETEFVVTVRDEFGTLLYRNKFTGGYFSKRFSLDAKDLGNNSSVQFEIACKKNNKKAIFKVERGVMVTDNTVIHQVK